MVMSIVCKEPPKNPVDHGADRWSDDEPCALAFDDLILDGTDLDDSRIDATDLDDRPPWEVFFGVRLSERCPDHFWRYFDLFVRYWPKKMFHRKGGYDSGFFAVKKRGTEQPVPLFPELAVELTERHLEFDTWFEWKQRDEWRDFLLARPNPALRDYWLARPDPIWLWLHMPKSCRTDLIDIDAKKYLLGYYRDDYLGRGPMMPVVHLPLDHFRLLKRVYDAFPDRIWCISSETLGVHAWKLHARPLRSLSLHAENKRKLSAIGLGDVEAHPMPGRCLRRPFGADCATITPNNVLESWTGQLDYFERDGRTPSFRRLCGALVARMRRQWERWKNAPYTFDRMRHKADRLGIEQRLTELGGEIKQVADWMRAGFPTETAANPTSLHVRVFEEMVGERPQIEEPAPTIDAAATSESEPTLRTPGNRQATPADSLAELRNGKWVRTLDRLARNGLDREDFIGTVAHEFAKWLYWIELFGLPEEQRRDKIQRLLVAFVLKKNNGYVTRLTTGQKSDVLAQLSRCLDSAIGLSPSHRAESLALFARIRTKYEAGRYKYPLRLEPLLAGDAVEPVPTAPSATPSSSSCPLIMCMRLESPLPAALAAMIQKQAGRAKVVPFATRLVNCLHNRKGRAYLGREALSKLLGYPDPTRILNYLRILERAGVIHRGTSYSKGRNGKECKLTREAMELLGDETKTMEG